MVFFRCFIMVGIIIGMKMFVIVIRIIVIFKCVLIFVNVGIKFCLIWIMIWNCWKFLN